MNTLRLFISLILFLLIFLSTSDTIAQEDTTKTEAVIEKLKYKQQPGLALAASKIFFSDKRYSISGFGEASFVNYQGFRNTNAGDLELYYTNLYRYAMFFGYRLTDKIIWNSEFQIELLQNGLQELGYEIVFEAFLDFIIHNNFKARVGYFPLTIGYVNNNDEPPMFYSVNRSEVERLIIPSTWIEFGAMFYGEVFPGLNYAFGITQGLNASQYLSGTWIRQGREITFGIPSRLSVSPQLIYNGIDNHELSVSGFFGDAGRAQTIENLQGNEEILSAPVSLWSGYYKYDNSKTRFVALGSYGRQEQTENIALATNQFTGISQIIGDKTYGYLFELGHDILPLLSPNPKHKSNRFYDSEEMKLPLFIRYERLDTHFGNTAGEALGISESVITSDLNYYHNNLHIWTLGANFKPKENIVFKANYQIRNNAARSANFPEEGNRMEFGFGFIF